MLEGVIISRWGLEYSVHPCPKDMMREMKLVFPGVDLKGLLIVPTCQRARIELVRMGEDAENEKDLLLERFMEWAQRICEGLADRGFWADYIDPCSGLPMIHTQGNCVYNEVEALSRLLQYRTSNAGCCKVLLHPKWGAAVYPATLVTKAPPEELMRIIQQVEKQQPPQ